MGYKYGGRLTGSNDPWQQPAPTLPPRPPKETRDGHDYYPRPDVEQLPGAIWHTRYGEWEARFKFRNQTIRVGRFRQQADAVAAVEARRTELQETNPDWRAPCGTHAAWQRHWRNGEDIDLDCRRAHNRYIESHRKKDKAA